MNQDRQFRLVSNTVAARVLVHRGFLILQIPLTRN